MYLGEFEEVCPRVDIVHVLKAKSHDALPWKQQDGKKVIVLAHEPN